MSQAPEDDAVVRALEGLRVQLDQAVRDLTAAGERLEELARLRRSGRSWSEIVLAEERPLVVESIATVLMDLGVAGGRFRREEACALHAEHVSIARIGQLFGVSRQRVSTIIRGTARAAEEPAEPGGAPHPRTPGDAVDAAAVSAGGAPEPEERDREAQVAQHR